MGIDVFGLINLCLYCAQQLGVALGLGAQTIMLVSYISATRDGVIDDTEAQFLRATRAVLWVSLTLMMLSGIAISALHFMVGEGATVLAPAYLFKSALIVLVILLTALLHTLPETFAEGLLGGTWYALFLVHILAPVTSWINLLTLYAIWLVGFNLIWYVIVFSSHERKTNLEKLTEKPKQKSTIPKAVEIEKTPDEPKAQRKPLFSFSFFNKSAPEPENTAETIIAPATIVVPEPPAQLQPIKLDPILKTPPAAPQPVFQTIRPIAPSPARAAEPIEKMPANIATDTPFLPQVPPLQPIPTIPPVPGTEPAVAVVPTMTPPASVVPPASPIAPEIKLGLNVMPKAPPSK